MDSVFLLSEKDCSCSPGETKVKKLQLLSEQLQFFTQLGYPPWAVGALSALGIFTAPSALGGWTECTKCTAYTERTEYTESTARPWCIERPGCTQSLWKLLSTLSSSKRVKDGLV